MLGPPPQLFSRWMRMPKFTSATKSPLPLRCSVRIDRQLSSNPAGHVHPPRVRGQPRGTTLRDDLVSPRTGIWRIGALITVIYHKKGRPRNSKSVTASR